MAWMQFEKSTMDKPKETAPRGYQISPETLEPLLRKALQRRLEEI